MLSIPTVKFPKPPAVLYKFRRFPSLKGLSIENVPRANDLRSQLLDTLTNGRVRLSRPTSFTDPFDCYARHVPLSTDPREQDNLVLEHARRTIAKSAELDEKKKAQLLADGEHLKRMVNAVPYSAQEVLTAMRNEDFRIYCLCAVADRPTMWSHYADAHRGVCVHFDSSRGPFQFANPVTYQRETGQVPFPIDLVDTNVARYVIKQLTLIKDEDWAYEREYRLLGPLERKQEEVLQKVGGRMDGLDLYFDPLLIVGLSIGANMDVETERELLAELTKRQAKFPVFRSKLAPDAFRVDVQAERIF